MKLFDAYANKINSMIFKLCLQLSDFLSVGNANYSNCNL